MRVFLLIYLIPAVKHIISMLNYIENDITLKAVL